MASKSFLRTTFPFPTPPYLLPTHPLKPKPSPLLLPLRPHPSPSPSPSPSLLHLKSPSTSHEPQSQDTVEDLLVDPSRVQKLMKMQRRTDGTGGRWFPYLDAFRAGPAAVTSREVLEALDGYILDVRKERMRKVVVGRSYSVSLVVEGLTDYGNVSAAFRSADALGVQSVHVISKDDRRRYRDNRHVSKGSEKWLDIELWSSSAECFAALRSRGYRIATTHLGDDAVSIYDMDWTSPIALVVGNEHMGISDEALKLSDLHCHIPMNGMVDSFNVSVASGILMHHAVSQRVKCLGSHGDLTSEESQILLAEFFLRHRDGTIGIIEEYVKRKMLNVLPSSGKV